MVERILDLSGVTISQCVITMLSQTKCLAVVVSGGIVIALSTGCSNTQYSSVKNSAAFDGIAANHSALNCVPGKFRTSVIQGYQAGLSDAAKNQYWALQRAQMGDAMARPRYGRGYPGYCDRGRTATYTEAATGSFCPIIQDVRTI